ncbi:hypothetical protein LSH36_163g04042 [Paralvinella palmiformis]|uniref:Ionotropic glutamate receptor C-terminal domain-containing protein n=1 Tax=Paralvinella palmiformis TaxID=53620 RepID=A0AAD9N8E4_9ANNE|nr:hypothetical protein LSH36_163g04042 [Paralvinella palmiformis]
MAFDERAHVAAGPLLDTSQRREVIDFTMPFLNVHATILMRKPFIGSHVRIRSVEDLINQSAIRYGTLDKGIIPRSFKRTNDSNLKTIWRNMNHFRPSTMTNTNEEGIKRARQENYAFIIQDTIADYIAMQDPCDLITVDKFLFTKSYALALPKNSRWLEVINKGMKMLKHGDTLRTLYRKWWLDKSRCDTEKPSSRSFSLAATSSATDTYLSHMTTVCVCLWFCAFGIHWTAASSGQKCL